MTHNGQSVSGEARDVAGLWRDRWSGDRFIVEHQDSHGYVHGRREFDGDGEFEPWSARFPALLRCYVPASEEAS